MEENAVSEKAGGKEVVTDMGLWREKNEATWISEQQCWVEGTLGTLVYATGRALMADGSVTVTGDGAAAAAASSELVSSFDELEALEDECLR
ncbi:MAG: hypothetical protein LQ348_000981 [Seirophora lacunosa]|nr:MAG: hypothetical protein LQ348_000981 [Seirophora lacunosa]